MSSTDPGAPPRTVPRHIPPGEPLSPAALEALGRRTPEELQALVDRANRRP